MTIRTHSFYRKRIAFALLFLTIFWVGAPLLCGGEKPFRAAVLHGNFSNQYGKNLHHNEFDNALNALGWSAQKYVSTEADMARLAGELDRYDILLVCPLFNYGYPDPNLPAKHGPALRDFIAKGGALVLTDAVYPSHSAWLAAIDPELQVAPAGCGSASDAVHSKPVPAYNGMPNLLRITKTFSHFQLPKTSRWETIARCGQHNAPSVIVARLGKGFLYATCFRHPNPQLLENMRANLELQRMNLVVSDFAMPKLAVGAGSVKIRMKNISNRKTTLKEELLLTPDSGKAIRATQEFSIPANQERELSLAYDVPLRGKAKASFRILSGAGDATLFSRNVEFPPLLRILPPRYRGMMLQSEVARTGRILVPVELAPYGEKLDQLRLQVQVTDAGGRMAGTPLRVNSCKSDDLLELQTGKLAKGTYRIQATLLKGAETLERKTADFRVVGENECPVSVNDDMNIVVNGKPFFPVGLYHVDPQSFADVASLGVNTIQLWSWFTPQSADEAARHGLHVIWEQNFRTNPDVIRQNVPGVRNKPNLLFWYGMDEPYEVDFPVAKAEMDTFHELDDGHPVYMVSCTPALFEDHAKLADIFAVDPYPYPSGPLTMVADWIDRAWQATKGNKPVVAIPQSFGNETKEAFRVMTYLALTHEARGIIWYPWDDGNRIGMKYNQALKDECRQICSEIKLLAPALLNKEGRRQFQSKDGGIHGLYCQDPDGQRYLLLVNPAKRAASLDLRKIPELSGVGKIENAFGSESLSLSQSLNVPPESTRILTWRKNK